MLVLNFSYMSLPHLTELESKAKPNIYFQIVPIKVPFSLSWGEIMNLL